MTDLEPDPELVRHLCQTLDMPPHRTHNLLNEVLSYYRETAEQYILRRHRELQHAGYSNSQIFQQLPAELNQRRFAVAPFSQRQIRRIIYG